MCAVRVPNLHRKEMMPLRYLEVRMLHYLAARVTALPACAPVFIIHGFKVKEGLGCVIFHAVLPRKTRNLALP